MKKRCRQCGGYPTGSTVEVEKTTGDVFCHEPHKYPRDNGPCPKRFDDLSCIGRRGWARSLRGKRSTFVVVEKSQLPKYLEGLGNENKNKPSI